jgi:hypothetical protein
MNTHALLPPWYPAWADRHFSCEQTDDSGTFERSETAQQFMNPGKNEAVKIVPWGSWENPVKIDHFAAGREGDWRNLTV